MYGVSPRSGFGLSEVVSLSGGDFYGLDEELLKRLQLRTITTADVALQLKYRDRLLEKMMPRRVEQTVGGSSEIRVVIEDGDDKVETPPRPETGPAKTVQV